MKITSIKATPVNVPMDIPCFWSVGLYPGTSKVVIEVETDEGITGLGEAPSCDCAEVINKDLGASMCEGKLSLGDPYLEIATVKKMRETL